MLIDSQLFSFILVLFLYLVDYFKWKFQNPNCKSYIYYLFYVAIYPLIKASEIKTISEIQSQVK